MKINICIRVKNDLEFIKIEWDIKKFQALVSQNKFIELKWRTYHTSCIRYFEEEWNLIWKQKTKSFEEELQEQLYS